MIFSRSTSTTCSAQYTEKLLQRFGCGSSPHVPRVLVEVRFYSRLAHTSGLLVHLLMSRLYAAAYSGRFLGVLPHTAWGGGGKGEGKVFYYYSLHSAFAGSTPVCMSCLAELVYPLDLPSVLESINSLLLLHSSCSLLLRKL